MATPLSKILWWDSMANERTLMNRDGTLMACLRLRGPDLHSALDSALIVQADQLNNCFKRFDGRWGLLTEARRREVRAYPQSTWRHPAARLVDEERQERFETPGLHYETEVTLTLTCKRPKAITQTMKQILYTDLPDMRQEAGVPQFEEQVRRTVALLSEACEEVEQLEDSALLAYLHSTVSWKEHPVAVPDPACYLDTYLTDTDLQFVWALPSMITWPKLGDRYLRCVSAKAYPKKTNPGLFDVLDTLPLEYRACVRALFLNRQDAIKAGQRAGDAHWGQRHRHGKSSTRTERAAMTRADDASGFQEGIELDTWSAASVTQTIVVWDATVGGVQTKAETVESALNHAGYTAKVEGLNTMAAWDATLPGNLVKNKRRTILTSQNLGHIVPAKAFVRGPRWNKHLNGPPLLATTGRGHTPFALDLHDDDVGHSMIIGPTGTGKSLLVALLAMQWLKYAGAQVYALDKDQSLRCATYAVGGDWYDLGEELERLNAAGHRLDDIETKPWGALWMPPPGWWQCYEMAGLLKTPGIIPQIVGPLLRQVEDRLTGVPTLISLDEAWVYLRNDFLRGKIQDYLLTLRKSNGVVLFSTQNLEHIVGSEIGSDIYQSCVTKIFLANDKALTPGVGKLYRDLGLTERECYIIATLAKKRQYYYMGVHGRCVFELGISPATLAFTGSGRKEDLAKMEDIYRGDAQAFGIEWLKYKGVPAAAKRLADIYAEKETT